MQGRGSLPKNFDAPASRAEDGGRMGDGRGSCAPPPRSPLGPQSPGFSAKISKTGSDTNKAWIPAPEPLHDLPRWVGQGRHERRNRQDLWSVLPPSPEAGRLHGRIQTEPHQELTRDREPARTRPRTQQTECTRGAGTI